MIEGLHGVKRAAAELLRFEGAYLRFSGEIRIEHYQGAEIVDQYVTDDAIWELIVGWSSSLTATPSRYDRRYSRTMAPMSLSENSPMA